jgi:hypothetical protein
MNYNILAYIIYLLIILYIVIYVGAVFYKNGAPFILNAFKGDHSIAQAVNKFLLVAYYLFNIGYSVIALRIWQKVETLQQMTEVLALKAGTIILIIGIAHMFNVVMIIAIGKRNTHKINTNTNLKF